MILHAFSALGTIYSVQKSQETEANVLGLHADLRDNRNASLTAKTALIEMKNVVGELFNNDKRIIEQLKFMQQETESLKKVTYLINKYEIYLNHVGDYLRDCNRELAYHRLSPVLMEYVTKPLWKEPASKWSEVKAYSVRLNQESDMVLNLQGRVPEVEENIKVLGAKSLKVWNRTEDVHCLMRCAGHRYILADTSDNCFDDPDSNLGLL